MGSLNFSHLCCNPSDNVIWKNAISSMPSIHSSIIVLLCFKATLNAAARTQSVLGYVQDLGSVLSSHTYVRGHLLMKYTHFTFTMHKLPVIYINISCYCWYCPSSVSPCGLSQGNDRICGGFLFHKCLSWLSNTFFSPSASCHSQICLPQQFDAPGFVTAGFWEVLFIC